jgi:L-aminopeptidase/D-esterase-like protein
MAPASVPPRGGLTDVPGLRVGHAHRVGRGWRTGTTVVLAAAGAVAGCDVRGGGPGTRETDLLRPEAMIERVHAICLSGGSAYGLAAADGVLGWLEEHGIGFRVGQEPDQLVPIVPAAVIFDLGRGGRFANRPDQAFGRRAAQRATAGKVATGAVGAGAGASAGGLQGGTGSASMVLAGGTVVAALAIVNAAGKVIDPDSGLPWMPAGLDLRRPPAAERAALRAYLASVAAVSPANASRARPPEALNTTIGVVACSARLTKAECHKLASVAHDGLARAVRPVHSMFDGDTIFALATCVDELAAPSLPEYLTGRARHLAFNAVLDAGAECFARACAGAVIDARSSGDLLAYHDLCPSAYRDTR